MSELFDGDEAARPSAMPEDNLLERHPDSPTEEEGVERDPDPASGDGPVRGPDVPARDQDWTGMDWPEDNDDPEQWPVADEEPDVERLALGLPEEYPGGDEAEYEAWLAAMPEEVRADYLAGPYTGEGEVIQPGFTHRYPGGPSGIGFAAGGALDTMPAGPGLAWDLADATADGHGQLGESELIGVLLGCQRQVAWSQAQLAAAVTELVTRRRAQAARPGWGPLAEHVADELAVALRLTGRSAGRLMDIAAGLARLPEVAVALQTGVIDWPKACILVDELVLLSDEQAHAVAAKLLSRAGEQTTGQLRAAVTRAVLAADPAAALRRRAQARKDTRVEVWHEPSGNAALAGRELAPADAIAADAALTADADWLRANGKEGTLAELRAGAYIARLSGRDLASLLARDNTPDPGSNHIPGQPADAGLPADPSTPDNSGTSGGKDSPGSRDESPGSSGTATDRSPGSNGTATDRSPSSRNEDPGSSGADCAAAGDGPGGSRRSATIHLTMPLTALAGLTETPGEVAGYGPADAVTCRELAARTAADPATRWCLTLTSPDGRPAAHACARRNRPQPGQPLIHWAAGLVGKFQFLETGTCRHPRQSSSYPWPASLAHLIEIRQRTCAAPGCRRPARQCDIDHTTPYDQGGSTCECNGAPLCRRHHRCKQAPGWHLTQNEPGHMTWQLPSNRTYTTTGDPYAV